MKNKVSGAERAQSGNVEFRKGCPVCEHSDLELEREYRVFAQLLLDIYFAKREEQSELTSRNGVDNIS
jgi:hypothetical protein